VFPIEKREIDLRIYILRLFFQMWKFFLVLSEVVHKTACISLRNFNTFNTFVAIFPI